MVEPHEYWPSLAAISPIGENDEEKLRKKIPSETGTTGFWTRNMFIEE
jgi:hypothetical protein